MTDKSDPMQSLESSTNNDFEPDAFVIRTSAKDGISHGDYVWPRTLGAIVECPDWKSTKKCGNGFHGLIDGVGSWNLLSADHNALWWIIGVKRAECINLNGKVKFPRGKVIYFGGINGALNTIATEWRRIAFDSTTTTGFGAHSATTGDFAHSATTGECAHSATTGTRAHSATTGTRAHSATTGDEAHSATTGFEAHSATTGTRAHSATTGDEAHSATTGFEAHSATTGTRAHSATTGTGAHSATTGDEAHSATTGTRAHSATTGDFAHSATTGTGAHSATTGTGAHSATTGTRAHSATTGTGAHSATTGDFAHSATTGDFAHSATTGVQSIAAGLGYKNIAKAGDKGAICIACFSDNKEILAIRASRVGENGIKPNTWYYLNNRSEFVEMTDAEAAIW